MAAVKLAGTVADLSTVPEQYRGNYEAAGDKFVLKEIEIEDVGGLRNTATARERERDEARKEAKAFKDAGVSIDEWNEYKANKDKIEADKLKLSGDWEARETQLKKQHKEQLDAKDALLSDSDKALHSAVITRDTTAALVAAGATEMGLDLLSERLERSQKMIDGKPRVVDAAGLPRSNSKGEPMTVTDLVEEFKSNEKYGGAFEASGLGGTGSDPTARGGGSNGAVRNKGDLKTDADKSAYIHEHGSEKYLDLPAAPAAAAK
jgi:hypothetical protein